VGEPVRRYLEHAIPPGADASDRVRLSLRARIRVGPWLDFDAIEDLFDARVLGAEPFC
jgi:hypothetical protein